MLLGEIYLAGNNIFSKWNFTNSQEGTITNIQEINKICNPFLSEPNLTPHDLHMEMLLTHQYHHQRDIYGTGAL